MMNAVYEWIIDLDKVEDNQENRDIFMKCLREKLPMIENQALLLIPDIHVVTYELDREDFNHNSLSDSQLSVKFFLTSINKTWSEMSGGYLKVVMNHFEYLFKSYLLDILSDVSFNSSLYTNDSSCCDKCNYYIDNSCEEFIIYLNKETCTHFQLNHEFILSLSWDDVKSMNNTIDEIWNS